MDAPNTRLQENPSEGHGLGHVVSVPAYLGRWQVPAARPVTTGRHMACRLHGLRGGAELTPVLSNSVRPRHHAVLCSYHACVGLKDQSLPSH